MSTDYVTDYERDGFVLVKNALPANALAPVIAELEALIDRRAFKLHETGEISNLAEAEPFTRRYATLFNQSQRIGRGLDIMYYRGRAIFDLLNHPALLDLVEPIVGPDITCSPIQHLRAKPPVAIEGREGPSFHNAPWHQDAGVMMAEADATNMVTCWLPLGSSNAEMGCLQVLPGLADLGYLPHIRDGETMIDPEERPPRDPVLIECEAGDVLLMNRFTPHCSTPNRSDACRWSLDLRYQTTGQHTGRTGHPAFEVRASSHEITPDYDAWCSNWIDAIENPRGFTGHRIDQR